MIEKREATRAGAFGLSLLADPLNVSILDSLKDGPLPLPDLRRSVAAPPQTTLRNRLRLLADAGATDRYQEQGFPGHVSYSLTKSGRALASSAEILAAWLAAAPDTSLQIGSPAAKSAIKALIGGWSTNMLRALAAKPLSLTELDRLITGINYPALERRLDAMRLAGQVAPLPAHGARPYAVTRWLRESVAPITAAVGWERRANPGTPDLERLDVEALLLLAVPMLRVPEAPDGVCRLEVQLDGKKSTEAAGVVVTIESGRATTCRVTLQSDAPNSARGTTSAWLKALSGHDRANIAIDGNANLPDALIASLRQFMNSPATVHHEEEPRPLAVVSRTRRGAGLQEEHLRSR